MQVLNFLQATLRAQVARALALAARAFFFAAFQR
jgi:hypothetical protein